MQGYYLCILQKKSNMGSTYFNQICSNIFLSKEAAIKEMKHRVKSGATAAMAPKSDKEFKRLPKGQVFFHIQEIRIT